MYRSGKKSISRNSRITNLDLDLYKCQHDQGILAPNNSGKFEMGSHQVLSLIGRMTTAKVKIVEDWFLGSLDNNRKFEVRGFRVSIVVKNDLGHSYRPGIG